MSSAYRGLKIKCEIFSAGTDGSYLRIVSAGTVRKGMFNNVSHFGVWCTHVPGVVEWGRS